MDGRLDIAQSVMCLRVVEAVGRGETFKLEAWLAACVGWDDQRARRDLVVGRLICGRQQTGSGGGWANQRPDLHFDEFGSDLDDHERAHREMGFNRFLRGRK